MSQDSVIKSSWKRTIVALYWLCACLWAWDAFGTPTFSFEGDLLIAFAFLTLAVVETRKLFPAKVLKESQSDDS